MVTATGRRFSLNMLSAVSPKGEFRFMLHEGTVTAPVFKTFLQRLMVGATHPTFQKLPELVKSFFRHNECLYALM